MSYVQNLSIRVPWHDAGWNGSVCQSPRNNTSCVLLENIGLNRDDNAEVLQPGEFAQDLLGGPPPCISERGSFLSPRDLVIKRKHPYRWKNALAGLQEATLPVPAWSVHAIPYFWMGREHVSEILETERVDDFAFEEENQALDLIGFNPKTQKWVLHGDNQKALIETFFEDVRPKQSLVFFYLRHSPFEESGRLLVGAALVEHVQLPERWPTTQTTAFPNHMWETIVRHSLRPDGTGGILLPLQDLAEHAAQGLDVSAALASAPQTNREFSYVTEHVPADPAVAALLAIRSAAQGSADIGLPVPAHSLEWLDAQLELAWKRRGVAPGLPAVLAQIGFEHPAFAARAIIGATPEDGDPWGLLTAALNGRKGVSAAVAKLITPTRQQIWSTISPETRHALRLLTRFDLTAEQVSRVLSQETSIPIELSELDDDPYILVTCSVDDDDPIAFDTVDRGCFEVTGALAKHPLPVKRPITDPVDPRRVEAVLADELAAALSEGHTIIPLQAMLDRLGTRTLAHPLSLGPLILPGLKLDPDSLDDDEEANWPVVSRSALADGSWAYKLRSSAATRRTIRDFFDLLKAQPSHPIPSDLEESLTNLFGSLEGHDPEDLAAEERARQEKLAALAELYGSRFSVLNGPAGTGKTRLIRALAERPEVNAKGVLLLAPTGKSRVQLAKKVGREASTIAQFLSATGRYVGEWGRYVVTGEASNRHKVGLVVVDEASMLTEDMLAALCDALGAPARMILIGDPRQLPPIGAGRPFVDLETQGRATHDGSWPRVAPGWTELTVLRRQKGRVRDDLMLARWFAGDDIPEGFDEVWERLRSGVQMPSLRAVRWGNRKPEQVIDDVLAEELHIRDDDDGRSFAASYGATVGQYVNYSTAPAGCERWQVLSPFRGRAYGTVQLNRHLKEAYRTRDLEIALLPNNKRWVPKPLGPERLVVGDKVVNLSNRKVGYWSRDEGKQRGYVANGEIGVVTGQLKSKAMKGAPRETQIEYSSQLGRRCNARGGPSNEEAPLELAWALTVHKSQGSEFGLVVLILPAGHGRLSRELLYTALTRQTDRVIVCHEGPIDDLLDLTRATGSDTGRRMTDLTQAPRPVTVTSAAGTKVGVLDASLVHVTSGGILVRSKNEVIIAGILDEIAPGAWAYEQPLADATGVTRLPDFTISTRDGRTIYWEHLGMLEDPSYATAWSKKKAWYATQGILPAEEGGGDNGTLVWTDDREGVDVPAWTATAEAVVGPRSSAKTKPTKKVASKHKKP